MAQVTLKCLECGAILNEPPGQPGEPKPCPRCGCQKRKWELAIGDQVSVHESLRAKVKDPTMTGKAKTRLELTTGDDLHRRTGRWFSKERVVDRAHDLYEETVVDSETGQVVHHCREHLSKHQGHGDARARRENKTGDAKQ